MLLKARRRYEPTVEGAQSVTRRFGQNALEMFPLGHVAVRRGRTQPELPQSHDNQLGFLERIGEREVMVFFFFQQRPPQPLGNLVLGKVVIGR